VDYIRIELVSVDGMLIGRTASDRWNLSVLGLGDLEDDGRSGASLKRARRRLAKMFGDAFTLGKVRGNAIVPPSLAEISALGEVAVAA
jgi:hypothetical protein